tara:strand:- start:229 stop:402 length:174 start_codon:yes stop_codon:yes gene_type:complete
MTINLRHALKGLSNREVYTLRFIIDSAKKEGVTLSELADFFLVEEDEIKKIKESLPW